jgi:nicotinate phosphoribosyltransferase
VIARADEEGLPGRPLLVQVMAGGERLAAGRTTIDQARERARDEIARLPDRLRALAPADPPYPVAVSAGLAAREAEVIERREEREIR